MNYLVDANVLSEPTRPRPDATVVDWLRRHEREIAIDPIILGELRFGIDLLPSSASQATGDVVRERCRPNNLPRLDSRDRPPLGKNPCRNAFCRNGHADQGQSDCRKAALAHGLTVVTRNVTDFRKANVKVLNPFGA